MNPQSVNDNISNIRLAMQDEPHVMGVEPKTKALTREGVALPNTNFIRLVLFYLSDKKPQRKDPPGYAFFLSGLQELGIDTGGPRVSKSSGDTLEDVKPSETVTPQFFTNDELGRFVDGPLTRSKKKKRAAAEENKSRPSRERKAPKYLTENYVLNY